MLQGGARRDIRLASIVKASSAGQAVRPVSLKYILCGASEKAGLLLRPDRHHSHYLEIG